MTAYLLLAALFIPINLWAAITPHLHSELSMRTLHGLSLALLLPPLVDLLRRGNRPGGRWRRQLEALLSLFLVILVAVNGWIVVAGMGVAFGWLDHLFLALALLSLILFYLARPEETSRIERWLVRDPEGG